MTEAELITRRNHCAAVACELLLAGNTAKAAEYARERRRIADQLAGSAKEERR